MDFKLSTADEIGLELAQRLKAIRLRQGIQQPELAVRAGISVGTVKAFEAKGQCTLASFLRLVRALGQESDLQSVFVAKALSIADMERAQRPSRQRAPRKPRARPLSSP